MNIVFMAVFYYKGPTRYLFRIFQIFKALGEMYRIVGCDVKYFAKQNLVLPLQRTISNVSDFDAVLDKTDLLFMWNGSLGEEKEMALKATKRGIPIYFGELGWLPQRGTFYFDRRGVNYGSTLTDWIPEELKLDEVREVDARVQFYRHQHGEVTPGFDLGKDFFVFIPLQVENDSQIIIYSPRFKKMQDLIDYVEASIPGQVKLYFKKHPKHDPGPLKLPDRAKLFTSGTTHDFLAHPGCRYVVTINSTVGIEALTYMKPVIVLGRAFYGGKKITFSVGNDIDMKNAVNWAEEGNAARGAIYSFLHMLFRKQWKNEDLKDPVRVLGLLEDLTSL